MNAPYRQAPPVKDDSAEVLAFASAVHRFRTPMDYRAAAVGLGCMATFVVIFTVMGIANRDAGMGLLAAMVLLKAVAYAGVIAYRRWTSKPSRSASAVS